MGEGLVGLRHLVGVFLLLHRAAAHVGGVHDLVRELGRHRALRALAGEADEPAQRQRRAAGRVHLDGDLVVRSAHAPALTSSDGFTLSTAFLKTFSGSSWVLDCTWLSAPYMICCEVARLPPYIIELMNLVISALL